MNRRQFVIAAASPALAQILPPWNVRDRLNQGPFDIDQDEGWQTILFTTPSDKPLRNPGLGLVGYTWEESGPSLAARAGRETLEQHVERISALPFVDVLYIRCDWRNVQKRPGRLDLDPIWPLTLDAARRRGLRVAFRVQLSSPNFEPREIALPEFLRKRIPLVPIGRRNGVDYVEPRYDDPNFQAAFKELNGLLAAAFNGDPLIEWVDLMQYGFWGEGHTGDIPSPFPDYLTAERTFVKITREQLDTWTKTPIAVNTQPDISNVGNRAVLDLALRAGAWLRTDSIWAEEPIQIDQIANRPPWCAAIFEDGEFRQYDISKLPQDSARVNALENRMLHALDAKANYWGLWTEAGNLATYNTAYPRGFERLRAQLGYRLRPAWVWERKRFASPELIIGVANRGVASVPGVLWLKITAAEGTLNMRGALDAGHPVAAGMRQASFILPRGFVGSVRLSAEIELRPSVFRPVAWACEQPLNEDGSITIEVKPFSDGGWRKGV